jgi:hypothetical protein
VVDEVNMSAQSAQAPPTGVLVDAVERVWVGCVFLAPSERLIRALMGAIGELASA